MVIGYLLTGNSIREARYNVLTSLMPYTAHRKDSRHRIVTNAEISPCTYYLDGEIESSQKGPVSYWDNSAHSSIEIISISFILKLEKGSPVTAPFPVSYDDR